MSNVHILYPKQRPYQLHIPEETMYQVVRRIAATFHHFEDVLSRIMLDVYEGDESRIQEFVERCCISDAAIVMDHAQATAYIEELSDYVTGRA